MYKGCETCDNLIYEQGAEDYDQYCSKDIDINNIPEEKESPNYQCKKWQKLKN